MSGSIAGNARVFADGFHEAPYISLLGLRIVTCLDGTGEVELVAAPELSNMQERVHGGVLASLLDASMATAILSLLPSGSTTLTINLNITYSRAAREQQTLTGRAQALDVLTRTASARATVYSEGDEAHAHAQGVFSIRRPNGK